MDSFPQATEVNLTKAARPVFLALAVVAALALLAGGVEFTTELWWFESLGFGSVFLVSVYSRSVLFVAGAVLFGALFAVNVAVARRLAYRVGARPRRQSTGTWEDLLAQIGTQMTQRGDYSHLINVGIIVVGALLALFMGLLAAGNWLAALQVLNLTPFGTADPVFGRDVSFYVFVMPALRAVLGWLFMALVLVALSVIGVYALVMTYELALNLGQLGLRLPAGIRAHVLMLLAAGFLLLGFNHVLDMFDLLRSTRGPGGGIGAWYADVLVQRPAQLAAAGAAVLAALLCLVTTRTSGFRPVLVGAMIWAVVLVGGAGMLPAAVQSVDVTPNELDRERPYLAANIQYTRQAFGLDRIDEREVAYEDEVTPAAIAREQATVNNVRLWDHRPLLATYNQIQSIRAYYQFSDVDVDRYQINGELRQVMVGAREIEPSRLPQAAQSWVSRQLQYTHGYGVAMSRVNVISPEGLPELTVRDVPPVGPFPFPRPEIYFGEKTDHYVIVKTSTPEFDYPRGDEGVFTTYAANSGVAIGGLWERLLFAVKLQDPNFLLNSAFRPESRLLYRRDVVDRVRQIAPFLVLDRDPYIVLVDGGLHWIQDAYTVTDRYPYSQYHQLTQRRRVNYIRNSVKVVTNAYDGSVRLYVTDPSDPLIQTYMRIYPGLMSPIEDVPASVRAHFRYPEDLFRIQADMFRLYHTQDSRVFYLREDEWTVPTELFYAERQPVEPYYVIMELPGESRTEFALILPFAPRGRDNMVGWLAARSDDPNYGRMIVYKYPKDKLVFGPQQIEGRIDQDTTISSQFSLWNQAGSQIIRGNLLVIPIGNSNLYIEPIYLQATANPLPELKRVVVANGNRIVMEATLEEALARLFGAPQASTATPGVATAPGPTPVPGGVQQLAAEAQDRFRRAQEALRAGDFARYGEEIRRLEEVINRLAQTVR